jgi:hypothetical protein
MAQSKPPESASLLRRLAEAADGYRDGEPRIVVALREPPHAVAGVLRASQEAEIDALLRAAGPGYEAFGPFATPGTDPKPGGQKQVAMVTVTYTDQSSESFSAADYDAVIWSVPAFDKLVMPNLVSAYGLPFATAKRTEFVSSAAGALPHKLYSF